VPAVVFGDQVVTPFGCQCGQHFRVHEHGVSPFSTRVALVAVRPTDPAGGTEDVAAVVLGDQFVLTLGGEGRQHLRVQKHFDLLGVGGAFPGELNIGP
jgi:hypothetical protein